MGPRDEERMFGMLSWVLQLVLFFIPPLILMFTSRPGSFVHRNAVQGLFFQLALYVAAALLGVVSFVTCGAGALLCGVLGLIGVAVPIIGGVVAFGGNVFEPPVSSGVAKSLTR